MCLNQHLTNFDAEIIPVKILMPIEFNMKLADHITSSTFYRYMIPYIPEDRILYLDSDIVVDGNIEDMYFSKFNGKSVLAVKDMYINYIEHWYQEYPNMKPYFNAGVILVNNKLWKENDLTESLIKQTQQSPGVIYADQDILNIVLKDKWGVLSKKYNYQVGALHGTFSYTEKCMPTELISKYESEIDLIKPRIIHYTSSWKPWLDHNYLVLLKEKYWFYYQLSWDSIKKRHQ